MSPPPPTWRHQLSLCGVVTDKQDVVVNASGEDLPAEWVKKQRKDGSSFYYCNTMTGAVQDNSPKEGAADATMATSATRPRRGIARMFQVRMGEELRSRKENEDRACGRPNVEQKRI